MYGKRDRIHWAGRAMLALFATAFMTVPAHATDGRIDFYGAIVAPTCGLDAGSVQQASQAPSHAVQVSCATTQNNPHDSSSYRLKLTSLNGATIDPRVQTYFRQFSPDAGTVVAVQTYR